MGQYHQIYNLDKKETFSPHAMGDGAKLLEWGMGGLYTAGIALLLCNSNGRGGGDLNTGYDLPDRTPGNFVGEKYLRPQLTALGAAKEKAIACVAGRWAGDRIVVQGDYAREGDVAFIDENEAAGYADISKAVSIALSCDKWLREKMDKDEHTDFTQFFTHIYNENGELKGAEKTTPVAKAPRKSRKPRAKKTT